MSDVEAVLKDILDRFPADPDKSGLADELVDALGLAQDDDLVDAVGRSLGRELTPSERFRLDALDRARTFHGGHGELEEEELEE